MTLAYDDWVKQQGKGWIWGVTAEAREGYNNYLKGLASDTNVSKYVKQVASALGVTLTDEQIANISSTFSSDEDLDKVKELIIARINTIAAENYRNPTVTPDKLDQVKSIFQSVFGRDASDDEAGYFAKELVNGKSAYELSEELKSLPEFQKIQANRDRAELDTSLQTQQAEVFKRATPQIIASFMKAGRLNSSGLNAALAQAQADLDKDRQSSLAQVGASDNATIRANAFGTFNLNNQPYMQAKNIFSRAGTYDRGMAYTGGALARAREIDDYNRQASDYQRYLSQQLRSQKDASMMNLVGQFGGGALAGLL